MKSFFAFIVCFSIFLATSVLAEEGITDSDRKAVADLGINRPTTEGETFGGIGMSFDKLVVNKVHESYPAHRAGIQVGDRILQVDETKVTDDGQDEFVRSLIRGKPGTKVTVFVERKEKKTLTFRLVRAKINTADYRKGFEFFEEALKLLQPLATKGMPEAQNSLGVLYEEGLGVERDEKKAAKLYRKAAEQGNASAQFNLGRLYYTGRGVPKNLEEALKWMKKAAQKDPSSP